MTKGTTIPTDVVRGFARRRPPLPMGERKHVVVGKKPHIFGLARLFQICGDNVGKEYEVVHTLEEPYDIVGARPKTLRSGCFPKLSPRHLLRGGDRHRALHDRGDALDVRDELRVQGHVETVRSRRSSGIIDCLNHHTQHRESHALDVGRLRADQGRHCLDGRSLGLRLLQHRQDALLDELGNLHYVARGRRKGMLDAIQ